MEPDRLGAGIETAVDQLLALRDDRFLDLGPVRFATRCAARDFGSNAISPSSR